MMISLLTNFKVWMSSKKGQGMVEYGLILALIAVVVIALLSGIGGKLVNIFTNIRDSI